jgi:two-component system, sensor histidine kinase and response regulator
MRQNHLHNTATASILVIDDAPNNLRLLMDILTEHGYDIRASAEAEFGLETARLSHPDLILLDILMPDIDGYTICQRLKTDERTRDIPVIFISALGNIADKLKGFEAGGVDYITKPFQAEEVVARVTLHLKLHALQHQVEAQNLQLQQEVDRREEAEEELRALNEQLETTNRQLQKINAGKDKFFSIIAHDLRSPFTGLLNLLQAILDDFDSYERDRLRRLLRRMHTAAQTTYALLTNLLEWSRVESGALTPEPVNILLPNLIQANLHMLNQQAAQKQIALTSTMPEGLTIYADYRMIETVLRNLLTNALKFTNSGGSIEVSVCQRETQVEITVSDTGIGIPPDSLSKLFRIDSKYQRPGTASEEGSGLGLVLCKELVEKNNGTIRVESAVNQGSRFIVSLPRPQ